MSAAAPAALPDQVRLDHGRRLPEDGSVDPHHQEGERRSYGFDYRIQQKNAEVTPTPPSATRN